MTEEITINTSSTPNGATVEPAMGQAPVIKQLVDLSSGHKAEAIYYKRESKQVICLSTQLSCAVGCVFCASPDGNKTVNLSMMDMLEQIDFMERYADPTQVMLYSFMGEGEPLQNLSAVIDTMQSILHSETNIRPIRFAVSTSGVKPTSIRKFANFVAVNPATPIKLQLSLHAPTDEGRKKIIPVSKPLTEIMSAMDYYAETTGGPIDINYTLIDGINDTPEDAHKLAELCKDYHVKISKYNKVPWLNFNESQNQHIFVDILTEHGVSVEYHLTDGESINAACGQTRGQSMSKESQNE